MRHSTRLWIAIPTIFLILLACQAVTGGFERLSPLPSEVLSTFTASPIAGEITATTTVQTQAVLLPTIELPATAQPTLPPAPGGPYPTRLHPDGELYAGDKVSIEIIAPEEVNAEGLRAEVRLETPGGEQTDTSKFEGFGIAGRSQATLYWVWDTTGLQAGDYPITYTIQPRGPSWSETVTLLPASDIPPPEPEAHWAEATSECCTLHYITGTAAQRDIDRLLELSDTLVEKVSGELKADYKDRVSITLLPRVLGHGGFTAQDISISYLDRNYAGSSPEIVLNHELVHALDSQLSGDMRPTLLMEGLAVYLSGGHFKPEPLLPRAAALLDLGGYLPLDTLIDNFYPSQHETGYLEAGALVEYMVDTWGWEPFSDFYRDIHPGPEGGDSAKRWSQSEAMDAALHEHFQISLSELENRFLQALRAEPVTEELRQDVRLSIRQYDAIRRYQQLLDPSAYFMTAWLPDGKSMRQKGIVADFLRHPSALPNVVLETMLASADAYLRAGDYPEAQKHLESIEASLARVEVGEEYPIAADALARDYWAVGSLLLADGYQAQRIDLKQNTALAWGTPLGSAAGGLYLEELELVRSGGSWVLPQKLNQGMHWNKALNGGVQYRFR